MRQYKSRYWHPCSFSEIVRSSMANIFRQCQSVSSKVKIYLDITPQFPDGQCHTHSVLSNTLTINYQVVLQSPETLPEDKFNSQDESSLALERSLFEKTAGICKPFAPSPQVGA